MRRKQTVLHTAAVGLLTVCMALSLVSCPQNGGGVSDPDSSVSSGSTSDSGDSDTNGGGGTDPSNPGEGDGTETDPPEETQPDGPGATFANGVLTVTAATQGGENKLTAEMVKQAVDGGSITKVVLPADVEVDSNAFSNISNVTFEVTGDASKVNASILGGADNVTLDLSGCSGGLTNNAFMDCSALSEVTLGSNLKIIWNGSNPTPGSFANCENLTTVHLNGISKVGNSAFYGCSGLTTVEGLENLQTIGARAFSNTKISGEIVLTSCTDLGSMAFEKTSITSISLPNLTGSIQSFSQCKQLQKIFVGGFNGIGGSAFRTCENLKVIYVGDDVGQDKVKLFLTKTNIGLNKEPEYVDYESWDSMGKDADTLYVVYNVPTNNFTLSAAYPQSTQLDGSVDGLISFFHLG